jgi:hypothetical protein
MSSSSKKVVTTNPAWMLRKHVPPSGSGVGFNTSMNKKPTRTTRKMGSPPPSPKRPKKHRGTRRRARNPRIMYE